MLSKQQNDAHGNNPPHPPYLKGGILKERTIVLRGDEEAPNF